jgi:hypothetical protein
MAGPAVRAPASTLRARCQRGLLGIAVRLYRVALLASLVACCVAVWSTEAQAQFQRNLPAGGVIGVLVADPALPLPLVRIDSRTFRMAPGGIIVDQNNRSVLHAQIPQKSAAYIVFDGNGDVQRMFLLTPDELQRLLRAR